MHHQNSATRDVETEDDNGHRVPPEWSLHALPDQPRAFFFHAATETCQWNHPAPWPPLPDGWIQGAGRSPSSGTLAPFYYHPPTGLTQWTRPQSMRGRRSVIHAVNTIAELKRDGESVRHKRALSGWKRPRTLVHAVAAINQVKGTLRDRNQALAQKLGMSLSLISAGHVALVCFLFLQEGQVGELIGQLTRAISVSALLLHLGLTLPYQDARALWLHYGMTASDRVFSGAVHAARGEWNGAIFDLGIWTLILYPLGAWGLNQFLSRVRTLEAATRDAAAYSAVVAFMACLSPILYFCLNGLLCLSFDEDPMYTCEVRLKQFCAARGAAHRTTRLDRTVGAYQGESEHDVVTRLHCDCEYIWKTAAGDVRAGHPFGPSIQPACLIWFPRPFFFFDSYSLQSKRKVRAKHICYRSAARGDRSMCCSLSLGIHMEPWHKTKAKQRDSNRPWATIWHDDSVQMRYGWILFIVPCGRSDSFSRSTSTSTPAPFIRLGHCSHMVDDGTVSLVIARSLSHSHVSSLDSWSSRVRRRRLSCAHWCIILSHHIMGIDALQTVGAGFRGS